MSCVDCEHIKKLRTDIHGRNLLDRITTVISILVLICGTFYAAIGFLYHEIFILMIGAFFIMFSQIMINGVVERGNHRKLDYIVKGADK